MNFHEKIVKRSYLLNDIEKQLLDYILDKKESIKSLTIKKISEENFVAPNTIVRMCKKLDFSGYSDFKISLMNSLNNTPINSKTFNIKDQLSKTDQMLNLSLIDDVVNIISNSNKIAIFASGLSSHIANHMEDRLRMVGKKTHAFSDETLMLHSAQRLTTNDCVIILSVSGETRAPLDATILAKSMGATIISITGLSSNSIADLAHFAIYAYCEEQFYEGIDISDRFVFFYIVTLIINKYINQLKST